MTTGQDNTDTDLGIAVPRDDPDMQQAVLAARKEVEQFIAHVQNPTETQEFFAVKVKLGGGNCDEFIWINDVSYDKAIFTGRLNNKTDLLPELRVGDEYKVSQQDIYDWMFIERGKLVGGYTIRVARAKMTPEDRKQFDEALWFTVE